MTRAEQQVRDSWASVVQRAIACGDDGAAYRLTVAFVRRLREMFVLPTRF